MDDFEWQGDKSPNLAATKQVTARIFLTKKSTNQFCQVRDYDILNTEVRA
jgi:hypothetical protein